MSCKDWYHRCAGVSGSLVVAGALYLAAYALKPLGLDRCPVMSFVAPYVLALVVLSQVAFFYRISQRDEEQRAEDLARIESDSRYRAPVLRLVKK